MEPLIAQTPVMGESERERARKLTLVRLRPPRRIPGYEQERFLGRGAFGEVWVAVDHNNGRKVAIKFYHRRGGLDWSLLTREVEKLRYLFGDRHIVQLLAVGWESDPPYYVMEYMESGSLEDLLRTGSLPVDRAVELTREIAVGLIHAHGKGILHCDLKPGNVMLDQDGQPRLADFGQSRLSHEHGPALGTLFYMAPEQADLKAAPDARWDVYALGAVLYRMLTGEAPFQTSEVQPALQQSGSLEERLSRYRHLLASAPRPSAHRAVPGVDSGLAGIIDRCLAVKPHERYANAQAVLLALDARAAHRARRPLLILGGLGPLLVLLLVLAVAALAFARTMTATQDEILDRAREGNRFAALDQAERLGQEVRTRWTILEHEARDPELAKLLAEARGPDDRGAAALCDWLRERHALWDTVAPAPVWFVLDRRGFQRGASEPDPTGGFRAARVNFGRYFGFRDYFHGRADFFPPQEPPADPAAGPRPLTRPHRSRVYRRQNITSPTYVVTYSVPVPDRAGGPPVGVLLMSSNLVGSTRLRGESRQRRERLVVLVDTRPDETGRRGPVVRHPYQEAYADNPQDLPIYYASDLDRLHDGYTADYTDPVGGDYYRAGGWLTAAEPVRVPGGTPELHDTGWLVLVEEDRAVAVQPVSELRRTLALFGVLAVVLVVVVLALMWGFVTVVFNAAPTSRLVQYFRRQIGLKSVGSMGSATAHTPGEATPAGA